MRNQYITLAAIGLMSQSVYATVSPISLATDPRIKVVPYEENNVVPVQVQTRNNTQIVFAQGESIVEVEGSDNGALEVSPKNLAGLNYLFIKPDSFGYDSNLTVITDRHTYYFHIIGNQQPVDSAYKYTYAVHFTYPEDDKKALIKRQKDEQATKDTLVNQSETPAEYNWDYSFSGSRQIMPLHVYDDGKFTYMQLQPNQPEPAIFAVEDKAGHEAIVNFRRQGNYLVIERLAPQFTLRDGKTAVASIFNNTMINHLRNGVV